MFPTAVVLEGKFISTFTLDHLDVTQVRQSEDMGGVLGGVLGYKASEVKESIGENEAQIRLLNPTTEERLTNFVPISNAYKTEVNNSDQPTELTNNANLSLAVSEVDANNSVVSGPRSPSNKGHDRFITNCKETYSEIIKS